MRNHNTQIVSWLAILLVLGNLVLVTQPVSAKNSYSKEDLKKYRSRVESMFYHAYDNYLDHAFPDDELRPLTCDGINTWGNFQLTLIDALDTLIVMGNHSEFRRVATLVISNLHNFNIDVNTSVFEANIRVVGGLLSAHLFSKRAGMQLWAKWPCEGPLLSLAEDLGRRLLPAFNTATGMPYGTVNLRHGVPDGETSVTCTACVGTFIIEFGTLSRLTGDPVFEETALRALDSLWKSRSSIGLVGNHIDVEKNLWQALDAGIGAGVDSYFEYLVKGALMFEMPELMRMFREYAVSIAQYLQHGDWHFWAHMSKGGVTQPVFQSLEAFWPGMLSLIGETDTAASIMHNYFHIWKKYGFTPEFFDVARGKPINKREGYPLRPELIESAMYMYQATKETLFLDIGVAILTSIEHSAKVPCGFSTIKNVNTHTLDNRMESFFLAETTKYLFLLFTPEHWIFDNGSPETVETIRSPRNPHNQSDCFLGASGYIFNTEAHPLDVSAVHCCSLQKSEEDVEIKRLLQRINLVGLLDSSEVEEDIINEVFNDLVMTEEAIDEEAEDHETELDNMNEEKVDAFHFNDGFQTSREELDLNKPEILQEGEPVNNLSDAGNQGADGQDVSGTGEEAAAGEQNSSESEVEMKTRELVEKKKNRIVEKQQDQVRETWRDLALNILNKLKAETGSKVAQKIKNFFEEPKQISPKLKSNVGPWQSMTCPRRPWPLEVSLYTFK